MTLKLPNLPLKDSNGKPSGDRPNRPQITETELLEMERSMQDEFKRETFDLVDGDEELSDEGSIVFER